MKLTELSSTQLRQLADIKDKISSLEQELQSIFGLADQPEPDNHHIPHSVAGGVRLHPVEPLTSLAPLPIKRRKMSEEAKAKIAASARRRWKKAKLAGMNHI